MLNDCLIDFRGFSVWKKVGLIAFQCQQNKLLVFEHQTQTDKWSVVVQPDKCFSMLLVFTPFCKITVLQTLHFELLVPFFCEIKPHFVSSKLWLCIESDSSLLTPLSFAVLLSQEWQDCFASSAAWFSKIVNCDCSAQYCDLRLHFKKVIGILACLAKNAVIDCFGCTKGYV